MTGSPSTTPRIGLDATSILGQRAGVGHAVRHLVDSLAACWPESWPPPRIWINAPRRLGESADRLIETLSVKVSRTEIPAGLLLKSWRYLRWPAVDRWLGPLDLLHAPAGYPPPTRSALTVLSVHDLYFKYLQKGQHPYGNAKHAHALERGIRRADHVIAVSAFLRDEVMRFYSIPAERVTVIPYAVDHETYHARPQAGDATQLNALGLEKPYLLCVATIEPRKNLVTLIEAYARARHILRAGRQQMPRLVITGQPMWGIRALETRVREAGIQDLVKLTGYVSEAALPSLYRQAMGLLVPSIYEGFGMSVLEAMACGCPAAVARASSLPEIGGDAVDYFNPMDSDAMARSISRFVSEPHLRGDLRETGLKRAQQFRWETCARATIDVYRRVLGIAET